MQSFREYIVETHEPLVSKVRKALSPDLLKPEYREHNKSNPMYGHCYAASEATYHMLGAEKSGYTPHRAKDSEGTTHWWLKHKSGHIIDPTAHQYTSKGKTPPYEQGRGGGFLTKSPSKRAQEIIRRVKGTDEKV